MRLSYFGGHPEILSRPRATAGHQNVREPKGTGPELGHFGTAGVRYTNILDTDEEGKTVVRGGFGVMSTPIAGEIVKNMVLNNVGEPFRSNFSRQDAATLRLKYPVFNQDVLPLVKGKVASPTFPYLDPHSQAPYTCRTH